MVMILKCWEALTWCFLYCFVLPWEDLTYVFMCCLNSCNRLMNGILKNPAAGKETVFQELRNVVCYLWYRRMRNRIGANGCSHPSAFTSIRRSVFFIESWKLLLEVWKQDLEICFCLAVHHVKGNWKDEIPDEAWLLNCMHDMKT